MRVAFIRVASGQTNDIFIDEHLGLGYLAATLDVNQVAESRIFEEPAYNIAGLSFEVEIINYSPDILAFTVDYTNVSRTRDLQSRLCSLSVQRNRAVVRVWGGHHASLCANQILEQGLADYVVPGNAEASFCELVVQIGEGRLPPRGVFLPEGHQYWLPAHARSVCSVQLPHTPRRDTLELLARSRGYLRAARVVTSRGCPFSCSFCTTPALRRQGLLPVTDCRAPEDVVREMEDLRSKQNVEAFYFNDDIFIDGSPQSKARAKRLAELVQNCVPGVAIHTQLRVDSLSPEEDDDLLRCLRMAGMNRVFLGVESGVDHVLEKLGKRTTSDQNLRIIRWYESHRVHVTPGRILFLPDTTWGDLRNTISLFEACGKAFYLIRRPNFRLSVFPGTEVYDTLKKTGRIKPSAILLGADYDFDSATIASFCCALEDFFADFIDVARPLFRLLNIELLADLPEYITRSEISDIRQECERATSSFLRANTDLGEGWSPAAFHEAAGTYLRQLCAIADTVTEMQASLAGGALS